MASVYTRQGDEGFTNVFEKRYVKNDSYIQLLGSIDELTVVVERALILLTNNNSAQRHALKKILKKLYATLTELTTTNATKYVNIPSAEDVQDMEAFIRTVSVKPDFVHFTTVTANALNECRVKTRYVERLLSQFYHNQEIRGQLFIYYNRLSDYFFALAYKESSNVQVKKD